MARRRKSGLRGPTREADIVFETPICWVKRDRKSCTVFRIGFTHSTSDSAYKMRLRDLPHAPALKGRTQIKEISMARRNGLLPPGRTACDVCGARGHIAKSCMWLGSEHCAPVPRCRCGLMLPCNDCLPVSAADFQAVRMRASGALGDTYSSRVDPSDDRREKDRMRKRAARAHLGAATTTGMETHQRRRG